MLDFFVDNTSVSFTVFAASCLFIAFFALTFAVGVLAHLERLRFVALSGAAVSGFIFAISLLSGVIGVVAGAIQSV